MIVMQKFSDWLRGLSVTRSMLLVIALPVTALLLSASLGLVPAWQAAVAYGNGVRMVGLAGDLSALVHEQQKERGATSVFLASGGNKFADELKRQRAGTDAARKTALKALDSALARNTDAPQAAALRSVRSEIGGLDALRAKVDRLELSATDGVARYTQLNGKMIDAVRTIAANIKDADAARELFGFAALLDGKDKAGLERAVGARNFARGSFTPADRMLFASLIAAQDAYFRVFATDASPAAVTAFRDATTGKAAERVGELRAMPASGDLQGVSAKDFFAAETAKIDALKGVEDLVRQDLVGDMVAKRASAWTLVALTVGGAVMALVVSLAGALLLARILGGYLVSISAAAGRLAAGELDAEIPADSTSEVGAVARLLGEFRASILTLREKEAAEIARKADEERTERDRIAAEARAVEEAAATKREAEEAERAREAAIAAELGRVVEACAAGRFDTRVPLEGKDGTLGALCAGVNRIGEATEAALNEVSDVMHALSDGDLTVRMGENYQGIFGEIAKSVNATVASLDEIVATIRHGGAVVRDSTAGIETAAKDLARRSEQNAASLEKTNAALTELDRLVQDAAAVAEEARGSTSAVVHHSETGTRIVDDTNTAIEEIRTASASITQIIDLIDSIAFQTNLLALNAGVEAARAGEAGRGFAVVATEVRDLAGRSSKTAQDISGLITESGQKVEDGVNLVQRCRGALDDIATAVSDIVGRVERLASSTDEQKLGIRQVASATDELDRTTQRNAAMFEETTAAISATLSEVDTLMAAVDRFRVSAEVNTEQATPAVPRRPARAA